MKVSDIAKSAFESDRLVISGGEKFNAVKIQVIPPATEGGKGRYAKVYFDCEDGRKYYSTAPNLVGDVKTVLAELTKLRKVRQDGSLSEPLEVVIYTGPSTYGTNFYSLFPVRQA